MLKGLGAGIIALILGIAAYKIVMGMVGFIQAGLQTIIIIVCVALGVVVGAAIGYATVEIIHRHRLHSSEYQARSIVIDRLASGQIPIHASIDVSRQVENMIDPPKRKALGRGETLWTAEPVEVEPADEVPAIEPPSKLSLDDLVTRLQEFEADEVVARLRNRTS